MARASATKPTTTEAAARRQLAGNGETVTLQWSRRPSQVWCRRWDSNPHELWAQRFLRPPRLPFRHFGVTRTSYRRERQWTASEKARQSTGLRMRAMERKTRLELATSSLARRRSTTELLPPARRSISCRPVGPNSARPPTSLPGASCSRGRPRPRRTGCASRDRAPGRGGPGTSGGVAGTLLPGGAASCPLP